MDILIRNAEETDLHSIVRLIREFAEHHDLIEFFEVTEERLRKVMFGNESFVRGLIAFDQENPIAYALFYPAFLSFRGQKSVYLEDIYISNQHRKSGIGEMLLRRVALAGSEFGAVRMDLQVMRDNLPAITFYKKHGAAVDESERHFKFVDGSFQKLVGN